MTDETKNDGGPAFPSEGEGHGNPQYHSPGMTLRDWFAGQAMSVMLAEMYQYTRESKTQVDIYRAVSLSAYSMADQMLEERSK